MCFFEILYFFGGFEILYFLTARHHLIFEDLLPQPHLAPTFWWNGPTWILNNLQQNHIFPSLFETNCDFFEILNFMMDRFDLNFEDPPSESHFFLIFWTELWHFWDFEWYAGSVRSEFWRSSIRITFLFYFLNRVVTFLRFWILWWIGPIWILKILHQNHIFTSLFEPNCDIFEILNFRMDRSDLNFEWPPAESHFSLTFWTELWHFWDFACKFDTFCLFCLFEMVY